MRMTELKPCPFCGGDVHEVSPEERGDRFWRIECASCGVRMGGTHAAMNRKDWNTRAEDAEAAEMAQRIQSLELECAKLQEELRKAGNRGKLTAEQVRDVIERHSAWVVGNNRCFHDGAYEAIADELNATEVKR